MVTTAGYGRWASPLTAAEVARGKLSLSELQSDGDALYWLEARPAEAGRVVLVRAGPDGTPTDHSPAGVSIRSRVHEYGGGAVALVPGWGPGAFAYVDQADQRVWFVEGAGAGPRPLVPSQPPGTAHRHGGLAATPDGDWVLAVREARAGETPAPVRTVVALSTRRTGPDRTESTLLGGHDFFGAPRVAPDGGRLAAVVWDHPDMPWDASSVVVLELERDAGGRLVAGGPPLHVAGGADESVGQPSWRRDGTLRFVSDRRGWWQPYVHPGRGTAASPAPLTDAEAEFHGPDWVLGQSTMAELPDGTLVARRTAAGHDAVVALQPGAAPDQPPKLVDQPCVSISALCAHGRGFALIGSTPDDPLDVWVAAPDGAPARRLRPLASRLSLGPADIARGEAFELTGRTGRPVHGTIYRPALAGAHGPRRGPPPLVTWCHSGPTSNCLAGLDPTLQFFTSRGLAVACVDYAGSAGYGRAYRNSLWGHWGVADSEDVLDAALHLARRGDVDGERLAVRGGSAGGMTALNALATGEGFAACTASFAVTDLMAMVATTHDFEAHYTDRLVGPLPETEATYEARSPVNRAAAMSGAVLLLQGTEDPVVPPAQAERMRDALAAAGVRCDLRFFEGEGHGFRRAETLTACLEAELAFYRSELHL